MSLDILLVLQSEHAFDPAPLREDLARYHVPFEDLVAGSRVEGELGRAVRAPERVALIGKSGTGKSSVAEFVLGPLVEGIAPIRIPVAAESDETISEPRAFVQHLVRTVTRYARAAALISEEERNELLRGTADRIARPGREVIKKIGLPGWLLGGTIAAEVRDTGESIHQAHSAADVIAETERLLDLIRAHGLLPVLLVDDSDSWLNVPDVDRTALVNAFFGRVVRVLADFKCGLVVAVHQHYMGTNGYKAATGFLETSIVLPELPDEGALGRVLEQRQVAHEVHEPLDHVWERGAVYELHRYYRGPGRSSLRKVMQVSHTALHHACADGRDKIAKELVETAISEWS